MKKYLRMTGALFAALLMVLSLFGCSGESADSKTPGSSTNTGGNIDPASRETLEFTYLRPVWGAATYTKDGPYEQELFTRANVKINVQIIPVAEYDAKAKLVISSRELPDVMWALGPVDASWRDVENQGAFKDLSSLIDSHPEVKATSSDFIWDMMRNEDGGIYFIPHSTATEVPFFMYYRKDWFDQLGIAEPTTIGELEAALEKIKAEMPDVIPMTVGLGETRWMFKDIATSFGAVMNSWQPSPDDANLLIPSFMTAEQKDYLFWLQDIRRRGLLDAEADLNPDFSHGKQKFMTGRAAAYPGGYPDYLEISQILLENDPNAEIGIMSPLTGPTGIKGGTRANLPLDRGFYIAESVDDEKAAAIFDFLEWTLTDGHDFIKYGIEGKMHTVVDGKKVRIPESKREDAYKQAQIEPLEFLSRQEDLLDFDDYKSQFEAIGIGDQYDYWKSKFDEYCSNKSYDYLNATLTSPTNADKGSQLQESYLNGVFGAIILDSSVTRNDYDRAVQSWLDAGGQNIIDEFNSLQEDKSQPDY